VLDQLEHEIYVISYFIPVSGRSIVLDGS